MSRDLPTLVIAIGLAVYGIYVGLYIPPMLVGRPPASMWFGFLLQTVAALMGALGVSTRRSWAPLAIVVLGAAIAATSLIEGFFLGIISYNRAVGVAVMGLVVTILTALYVSRHEHLRA
jgi:hypothetical protein